MAVFYPVIDITRTTADTVGQVVGNNDVVIIKHDIEVAATGTGTSHGLNGAGVDGVDITVAGTVVSALATGIRLTSTIVSGTTFTSDYNNIHVAEGGLVVGQTGISVIGDDNTIRVTGEVSAADTAIVARGDNAVQNAGQIQGLWGVFGEFGMLTMTNSGEVSARAAAVLGNNAPIELVNSGLLSTTSGTYGAVQVYGSDAEIINSGTIQGSTFGIALSASAGAHDFVLTNSGVISGSSAAIRLDPNAASFSWHTAVITNSGEILGRVVLEDGYDLYDGSLGKLVGKLDAGNGDDTLIGGGSTDRFEGGNGDDDIQGGGGDDVLSGGQGNDLIQGGAGDDLIEGGFGADLMDGGDGIDTLSYLNSTFAGITINMTTGEAFVGEATGDIFTNFERVAGSHNGDIVTGSAANDSINGNGGDDQMLGVNGNDLLRGGAGADTVDGGNGDDMVVGGDGADLILGGANNDRLRGDAGNDSIEGGAGADILIGGLGADAFRFTALADSTAQAAGRDRVIGFSQAEDDVFDLSLLDAIAGGADDAFTFIGTAAFTQGVAGQLRYAEVAGDTLIYADVNGDRAADFMVQMRGVYTLEAGDFVL